MSLVVLLHLSLCTWHASQDCTQILCFLTFSGLSDEASTKDWEKCTIPTFLFNQNLWHQELEEAFRQSSYSPARYNRVGERGQEEKGETVKESEEGKMTKGMPKFLYDEKVKGIA